MKLAALILLCAIVGKISAHPHPLRVGYYRMEVPEQQALDDEESDEVDAEVSAEDFSNDKIQDDDDDSDEQEPPPQFNKLFPLPQANSPGYNMPLSVMMGGISAQGWNVPKKPQQNVPRQRGRDGMQVVYDDDDDDDDDDEDEEDEEEDDEPEDDLPDWQKLFPSSPDSQGQGPPAGIVDSSAAPEIPAAYRSALPAGSRVVYVPARQLRQQMRRPIAATMPRQYGQYVMRAPSQSHARAQTQYMYIPTKSYNSYNPYMNRQPMIVRGGSGRPQQVMLASSASSRRPQQQSVYYMPVRRGSYSPYTSAYVPRYRY